MSDEKKYHRPLHEGKTCPECGGTHFGNVHCPFSEEGKVENKPRPKPAGDEKKYPALAAAIVIVDAQGFDIQDMRAELASAEAAQRERDEAVVAAYERCADRCRTNLRDAQAIYKETGDGWNHAASMYENTAARFTLWAAAARAHRSET